MCIRDRAEPLLGEVGSDATIINQDKEDVAKAVTAAAGKEAGDDSLDAAAADKVASVSYTHLFLETSSCAAVTALSVLDWLSTSTSSTL